MTDLLAAGSAHLATSMRSNASTSVTYRRGAHSVVVPAVFGQTDYEQEVGDAGAIRFSERDFIVLVNDLVLNGAFAVPKEGDTIEYTQDSALRVFRVAPTVSGEAPFTYTTPHRHQFRIHTKLASEQGPSPEIPIGGGGDP